MIIEVFFSMTCDGLEEERDVMYVAYDDVLTSLSQKVSLLFTMVHDKLGGKDSSNLKILLFFR